MLNTALFFERRSDAHARSEHYVGFTKVAGDEADVLEIFPRRSGYAGQMEPSVLRLHGDVRIVLLKPIGAMPDPAIDFLSIEAVGQNRTGDDRDRVDQMRVLVCALQKRCAKAR